jgi:hypothetical protein
MKIDAPRLLTPTAATLNGTRIIEFCGQDGILAQYTAISVSTENGDFEVSLSRLAFKSADQRAATLARGAGTSVELMTLGEGKRLAYKVTVKEDAKAAS